MFKVNAQPLNKALHLMHKVRTNYSSCIARSGENICSSNAEMKGKGKAG